MLLPTISNFRTVRSEPQPQVRRRPGPALSSATLNLCPYVSFRPRLSGNSLTPSGTVRSNWVYRRVAIRLSTRRRSFLSIKCACPSPPFLVCQRLNPDGPAFLDGS